MLFYLCLRCVGLGFRLRLSGPDCLVLSRERGEWIPRVVPIWVVVKISVPFWVP